MRRGLIVGKMLPPHAGHSLLIDEALSSCDEVVVALLSASDEPIPGELRARWLREMHPSAIVRHRRCDHVVDFHDDAVWRYWIGVIRQLVPEPIDVVFSSELYGVEMAERLGAAHVSVDPARRRAPVSGTAVRADPLAHWDLLGPPVRAHYAVRVAVVGAESAGKSTLAEQLAAELRTTWVPEFGRAYCETKFAVDADSPWSTEDFIAIARGQAAAEDAAARTCNRVLITDTDAHTTGIWHERYMGRRSAAVDAVGAGRLPDLYLLVDASIPWVQDGTRDSEHLRGWMDEAFRNEIPQRGTAWMSISGSRATRLAEAVPAIRRLEEGRRLGLAIASRWSTPR